MRKITIRHFIVLLTAVLISPIAAADDADDIRAVVDVYLATEGSDLKKQASLMTDDRIFINQGRRQTNNVANMEGQIAASERNRELDPKTTLSVNGEDVIIRVYGNAAVASFYRYWNVLASAESIRAGNAPSGPPDDIVTLVLAKSGGDWKIVHTHQSALSNN